jgi:hypothetical protein
VPLLVNIVLPALLAVIVETLLLRLSAIVLRLRQVSWIHCTLFAFAATFVVFVLRAVPLDKMLQVNLLAAMTLSLVAHATLGALIFSKIELSAQRRVGVFRGASVAALAFLAFVGLAYAVLGSFGQLAT